MTAEGVGAMVETGDVVAGAFASATPTVVAPVVASASLPAVAQDAAHLAAVASTLPDILTVDALPAVALSNAANTVATLAAADATVAAVAPTMGAAGDSVAVPEAPLGSGLVAPLSVAAAGAPGVLGLGGAQVEAAVILEAGQVAPVDAAALTDPAPIEAPKELEEDAEEDKRPRVKEQVAFLTMDTTLNIMPSVQGNVLMALTDGGMQYLLAGARANTGLKYGRYMFEAKIVEILNPAETDNRRGRTPVVPRQLLRIGFSTAGSCLFLGETEESVCFDSDGSFVHNKKSATAAEKFARDQVIGVVLNLEEDSPNANTVSLFRDGARISQPQLLPECLRGKPLFPAVTFRNLTVHVNFGPASATQMPFRCRMVQDASHRDAQVLTQSVPKDGKYEVIFPVCLPDEGTFDWLDTFLEKHPEFCELSDRKILDWAERSGVWRPKGYTWKTSNDKPDMSFNIAQMDDQSIRRILNTVAQAHQRHFIYMEVKSNLIEEDRREALKRFCAPHFRTVAQVMIGEPTRDFKEKVHSVLLKDKQDKAEVDFKARQTELIRKRLAEKQQRDLEREQRRAIKAARKAADATAGDEARKQQEGDAPSKEEEGGQKSAEAGEQKQGDEHKEKDGEQLDGEEDDEAEDEDEKMEDEQPPQVQLTDEEKRPWFRKASTPDMTAWALSTTFTKFTIPSKDEGFDDVRYEWFKKSKCSEYLREWILGRKLTTRKEDIVPSEWFGEQWTAWQNQLQKWHQRQSEWSEAKKASAKDAETKQVESNEGQEAQQADNEEVKAEVKDANESADDDELDIFGVEDVCNVGNSEPLFANFSFEDWALLSLRYELHLLAHAFRRDVDDPERLGIHVDHLLFYYNKYFRKTLHTKSYGVDTYEELVDYIKDAVVINPKNSVLEPQLSDELDTFDLFLKLTEEGRRERGLQIDSGEDSARLNFVRAALTAPASTQAALGGAGGAGGAGGGGPLGTPPPQARPYQRGPRPPMPGRGYAGPQGQKQWYGGPQVQKGGSSYYGGTGGNSGSYNAGSGGGYRPPLSGGARGYGGPGAGTAAYAQKRPYYSKGYGR